MNKGKTDFSWVKKEAMKHGLTLKEFFNHTSFRSYNYMIQILNGMCSIPENANEVICEAFSKISTLKNKNNVSIVHFNIAQPYFNQIFSGEKDIEIRPVSMHWLERLVEPINYMNPLQLDVLLEIFKNPFINYNTVDEIFEIFNCKFKAFNIISIRNGFARVPKGKTKKKEAPFIIAKWEGISIENIYYPITGKKQYCFVTKIGDIINKGK